MDALEYMNCTGTVSPAVSGTSLNIELETGGGANGGVVDFFARFGDPADDAALAGADGVFNVEISAGFVELMSRAGARRER